MKREIVNENPRRAEINRRKYERKMAKRPRAICAHCSKEIAGHRRKFCDVKCRSDEASKNRPKLGWIPKMKNCRKCGTEFLALRPSSCLCGPQCRSIWQSPVPVRPQKHCVECNSPMAYHKRSFCSPACNRISDNRKEREVRKIKSANRPVFTSCHCCKKPTSHGRKYCDRKCKKKTERIRKKERSAPKVPPPVLHCKCDICSTDFDTTHPTKKFCSHKCRLKSERNKRRIKEKGKKKPIHVIIKNRLSGRLRELLRREGRQKTNAISKYMGCTPKEMLAHVDKQLEGTDMNWSNYGVFGWHLDHIIPCAKFDLTNEEHVAVCFNWRNIRPLWGVDNYSRQDNVSLLDALEIPKELFEMAEKLGIKLWV